MKMVADKMDRILTHLAKERLDAIGEAMGLDTDNATDRDRRVSREIAELLMEPETNIMTCQIAHEIFRQYCTAEDPQNVFFSDLPHRVQELEHIGLVSMLNYAVELVPGDKRLRHIRDGYSISAGLDAITRSAVVENREGSKVTPLNYWGNVAELTLARFIDEWTDQTGEPPDRDFIVGTLVDRAFASAARAASGQWENIIEFPKKH